MIVYYSVQPAASGNDYPQPRARAIPARGPCVTVQHSPSQPRAVQIAASLRGLWPGLALSAAVAIVAVTSAPLVARLVPIPAMVIALFIGIALNPLARRPTFQPGIVFCLKTLLPWAVALLGLRIALGEIAALGLTLITTGFYASDPDDFYLTSLHAYHYLSTPNSSPTATMPTIVNQDLVVRAVR